MTVTVNKDKCIGCGYCFTNCEAFEQDSDGLAKAKENISEDLKEEVEDTKDACPMGAIETK